MRIAEVTFRHRNDFRFIAICDCGHFSRWGDGYSDAYYQRVVFPNRNCPFCGMSEFTYRANRLARETSGSLEGGDA